MMRHVRKWGCSLVFCGCLNAVLIALYSSAFAKCSDGIAFERRGRSLIAFLAPEPNFPTDGVPRVVITAGKLRYNLRFFVADKVHPRDESVMVADVRPEAGSVHCTTGDIQPSSAGAPSRKVSYTGAELPIYIAPELPTQITFPCLIEGGFCRKPVIYLYPRTVTDVSVKLRFPGRLVVTYPAIDHATDSWSVTASPEGRMVNRADGETYPYLFWEGEGVSIPYDETHGFVVKREEVAIFLPRVLTALGLSPHESEAFISYWQPVLERNPLNYVYFATEEYSRTIPLDVSPRPDTSIRVFMLYRPLSEPVNVIPQELKPAPRKGFTLVEWGGGEIPEGE